VKKILLLIMMGCLLTPAYADESSAAVIALLEEISASNTLIEGYDLLIKNMTDEQFKILAEHFGYGDLLNTDEDVNARKWSPDTWESALQGLSGGNDDRYQELVDEYQKNHPYLSSDEMRKGASDAYTTNYEQQVETNRAAMAHASYSFENVNKHLDQIKELSSKINQAENQKAIEEINARINTEVAYLQVEQIKSLAIMNEQLAQSQASVLVHEKAASEFNQIPEK